MHEQVARRYLSEVLPIPFLVRIIGGDTFGGRLDPTARRRRLSSNVTCFTEMKA